MNETAIKMDLDNVIVDLKSEKDCAAFLDNVPCKRFDDMIMTYRCIISEDEKHLRSFLITNGILDYIKISPEEIHDIAMENTSKRYPCSILTLDDMISDIANNKNHISNFNNENLFLKLNENDEIYILTNISEFKGAVNIVNEEIMNKIAENFADDIVIHPLGVNNVIIVPMKKIYEKKIDFAGLKELNDWQNSHVKDKITEHLHVWNLAAGRMERLTEDYVKRYVNDRNSQENVSRTAITDIDEMPLRRKSR